MKTKKEQKQKIMNFADGPSVITVGQTVVYDNGQGGRHSRLIETTVEKIGSKLVKLKNSDEFYLADGAKKPNTLADFSIVQKRLTTDAAQRLW